MKPMPLSSVFGLVRDEAALSAIEAEEVLKAEAELPTVNKSQNAAPRYNGNVHQIRMQEKIENYSATQKVASMQISRMRFIFLISNSLLHNQKAV